MGVAAGRSDIGSALLWVDPLLGEPAKSIRLALLDEGGRWKVAFERVRQDFGGSRTLRRREAIVSMRPCVVNLRRTPGESLAILPLAYGNEALGVLEIVAKERVIGERLAALEAVSGQTAQVLGHLGAMTSELAGPAASSADVPELLQELLAATERELAVAAVVRFWHRAGMRSVAWLRAQDGHRFRLVTSRGIDRETVQALRRRVDTVDADAVVRSAGRVLGGAQPIVTRARDAVVLLNGAVVEQSSLETVRAGLGLALDRLALSETVADLAGSIDAGLAWTAHELRAPLLGVERAIDSLDDAPHQPLLGRERRVLDGARAELRRLTGMVDDVLRWSVGAASIRRRPTDLVRLVEESARSVSTMEEGRRLNVARPENVPANMEVCVDPHLLRIAVENLLRNSLQHAEDDIDVSVELTATEATVSVSDAGPGVPSNERATIFEPFVRGRRASNGGRGLGLFIAQRVVQAHGGALWLEPAEEGSVFRMRFPREAA